MRLPRKCFCYASVFLSFPFALGRTLFSRTAVLFCLPHLRGDTTPLSFFLLFKLFLCPFRFSQGGCRYFPRSEITALVGGPGNMAVYRHILVIPPTAKVLPSINENRLPPKHYRRIALQPKKFRHILVLALPPKRYQP